MHHATGAVSVAFEDVRRGKTLDVSLVLCDNVTRPISELMGPLPEFCASRLPVPTYQGRLQELAALTGFCWGP